MVANVIPFEMLNKSIGLAVDQVAPQRGPDMNAIGIALGQIAAALAPTEAGGRVGAASSQGLRGLQFRKSLETGVTQPGLTPQQQTVLEDKRFRQEQAEIQNQIALEGLDIRREGLQVQREGLTLESERLDEARERSAEVKRHNQVMEKQAQLSTQSIDSYRKAMAQLSTERLDIQRQDIADEKVFREKQLELEADANDQRAKANESLAKYRQALVEQVRGDPALREKDFLARFTVPDILDTPETLQARAQIAQQVFGDRFPPGLQKLYSSMAIQPPPEGQEVEETKPPKQTSQRTTERKRSGPIGTAVAGTLQGAAGEDEAFRALERRGLTDPTFTTPTVRVLKTGNTWTIFRGVPSPDDPSRLTYTAIGTSTEKPTDEDVNKALRNISDRIRAAQKALER